MEQGTDLWVSKEREKKKRCGLEEEKAEGGAAPTYASKLKLEREKRSKASWAEKLETGPVGRQKRPAMAESTAWGKQRKSRLSSAAGHKKLTYRVNQNTYRSTLERLPFPPDRIRVEVTANNGDDLIAEARVGLLSVPDWDETESDNTFGNHTPRNQELDDPPYPGQIKSKGIDETSSENESITSEKKEPVKLGVARGGRKKFSNMKATLSNPDIDTSDDDYPWNNDATSNLFSVSAQSTKINSGNMGVGGWKANKCAATTSYPSSMSSTGSEVDSDDTALLASIVKSYHTDKDMTRTAFGITKKEQGKNGKRA